MKQPLVSIITPCYNVEKWIDRYLTKFLEQTYDNVELILINDGSKDRSEEIILSYRDAFEKRGFRLVYLFQENKGLGGAINTGLQKMTGDYFAWCDSDNFYTNDYIATKVDFLEKNQQYAIVRCDGYIVKEEDINMPIGRMSDGNNDLFQEKLFYNAIYEKNFHFGCAMIRTKDFLAVNPDREIYPSRHGQNWQILLPIFYHYQSGYIDRPMFYFVYRSDSVSNIVQQQSTEKRLEQQDEHEKILITTVLGMHISEEEFCIHEIKKKYALRRFEIVCAQKSPGRHLTQCWKELKQYCEVTSKQKRGYFIRKIGLYRVMIFGRKLFQFIKR